jgi:ABC-2 type transport system ATP-binding protein
VIEVRHLTKRYGDRTAVNDLSFSVARGEVVGFLGPNGAGKSTTLRMLTGFLSPTEGEIQVAGIDARKQPLEVKRRIGYMPEAVPLYLEMRVVEYLRYRAELKGVARKDIGKNVDKALQLASVADVRNRIIGQLSKGYRQRVGLADALVADPPLLILDEPTAGLDPNQIRQVRDLVRALGSEKTVFLSTHILPEVEAICGRVIILDRGRLVSSGKPDELRIGDGGRGLWLEAKTEAAGLRALVEGVAGVRAVSLAEAPSADVVRVRADVANADLDDVAERLFRAVAEAGIALRELKREERSLEDVFARLTVHDDVASNSGSAA